MIAYELRPLSIGEILDRAVDLCVRNFAVLVRMLAVVAVPLAGLDILTTTEFTGVASQAQRLQSLPRNHVQERNAILLDIYRQTAALTVPKLAATLLLSTLSSAACMIGVAQIYGGKLPRVRFSYAQALRRWRALLAALATYCGLGLALLLAVAIVMYIVFGSVAGLFQSLSPVAGTVVGLPLALVAVLIAFTSIATVSFAAQMTLAAIVLDAQTARRSITLGLRRTLGAGRFWRSALAAIIAGSIASIGFLILQALGAELTALSGIAAFEPVVAALGGIVVSALLTCLSVVYALDVRVRSEGYDLALVALSARLEPPGAPASRGQSRGEFALAHRKRPAT